MYEGFYSKDRRDGPGKFMFPDGRQQVLTYQGNDPIGEGARWSADGQKAWRLVNGKQGESITLSEAAQIAERVGAPMPKFGDEDDE